MEHDGADQTRQTEPGSPCINVCTIGEGGLCEGCARTLDEIARWGSMSPAEQRALIEELRGRGRTRRSR